MIPQASNTERGAHAAERKQADREWIQQVNEETVVAETAPVSPENLAAKTAAEAELQTLREEVAADKARRAIVAAKVKGLMGMVNSPAAGEDPAETAKMVGDLKAAQTELRDLDVATLMSEQKLAAREADYRKDFPETLN